MRGRFHCYEIFSLLFAGCIILSFILAERLTIGPYPVELSSLLLRSMSGVSWTFTLSLTLVFLLTSRLVEDQYGHMAVVGNIVIGVSICIIMLWSTGKFWGNSIPTMLITTNILLLVCHDHPKGKIPLDGIFMAGIYVWSTWELITFNSMIIGAITGGVYILWKWREVRFKWTGFCIAGRVTLVFGLLCLAFTWWGWEYVYVNQSLADGSDKIVQQAQMTAAAKKWFTTPLWSEFELLSIHSYAKLVTHIFGHAHPQHFMGNMVLLMIIGRRVEIHYGPGLFVLGLFTTAVLTAFMAMMNGYFLIGASGVLFMLFAMSAFIDSDSDRYPVSGLILFSLYTAREVGNGWMNEDELSQQAHVIGAVVGLCLGLRFSNHKLVEKQALYHNA